MAGLTISSVLGKHLENIVPIQGCQLNLKVTRIQEAYIEKLEEMYLEHGVWEKVEALAKTADFRASEEASHALEGMDRLTTNLMLCAEKSCRTLNSAHYESSPLR